MLAKKFRLPVGSFPKNAGTAYKGKHLAIKSAPNGLPDGRVGVILTKKTAPKATERNRLRRKIYDRFTPQTFKEQNLGGRDLLVVVKPIKLDRDTEGKLLEELTSFNERH